MCLTLGEKIDDGSGDDGDDSDVSDDYEDDGRHRYQIRHEHWKK